MAAPTFTRPMCSIAIDNVADPCKPDTSLSLATGFRGRRVQPSREYCTLTTKANSPRCSAASDRGRQLRALRGPRAGPARPGIPSCRQGGRPGARPAAAAQLQPSLALLRYPNGWVARGPNDARAPEGAKRACEPTPPYFEPKLWSCSIESIRSTRSQKPGPRAPERSVL